MPVLKLKYGERSTVLDRLERMADLHEITREELAKRFIADGLGDFGLPEHDPDKPEESLDKLFQNQGLLKPNKD